MKGAKTVDEYIEGSEKWGPALAKLREILRKTELEETVKWGAPCYTFDGKNVVGLVGFQEHCALWFHQGALLSDPEKVLVNAQEGKTKALRHWRFSSAKEIRVRPVRAYVEESIEHLRAGREIRPDRKKPLVVPPELRKALAKSAPAKKAFEALSPGRRREYADHIADAKQASTKERRLEKILPMIRKGIGLHDKYRC